MLDLLKQFAGSRVGLTVICGAATALVATATVPHDSAEGKALGAGAVGVVLLGATLLGPKVLAWVRSRGGPPASPSA